MLPPEQNKSCSLRQQGCHAREDTDNRSLVLRPWGGKCTMAVGSGLEAPWLADVNGA